MGQLLGLSGPREAQVIVCAAFDVQDALTGATMRAQLAKMAQRRRTWPLAGEWPDAFRTERAAYGPDNRVGLLRDLNLPGLAKVLGSLTRTGATFRAGMAQNWLHWQVSATSATGARVTLAFEPFNGRLARLATGGRQ